MTIQQFIEAAIKGGWIPSPLVGQMNYGWQFKDKSGGFFPPTFEIWDDCGMVRDMPIEEIVIDPKTWKAVGKVKGWAESKFYPYDYVHATGEKIPEAQWYFRCMGNALWEGQTLEEYITTL